MSGTVYGIGVGPGDPELITLKAKRLLETLPVLAWPAPLEGEGLARRIAAPFIPEGRTEIAIRFSFRPERDDTAAAYAKGARDIAAHLAVGQDVGVLCEGDPLLFGSFIHLLEHLPDCKVQVVPGIASPLAAAALTLRPLATLDEAFVILPATRPEAEIERVLSVVEAAAIIKIGRHRDTLARVLDRLGLIDDAVAVERAGMPDQAIRPFRDAVCLPYFSLVLVRRST